MLLVLLFVLTAFVKSEEMSCDLSTPNQTLCNLYNLSKISKAASIRVLNVDPSTFPIKIDQESGDVNWSNTYQPGNTRWSSLCQPGQHFCLNNCDLDGFCAVKFEINARNILSLKFRDNLNHESQVAKFGHDLKMLNLTLDLGNLDNELVLLESTKNLDPFKSKPSRVLNQFELSTADNQNCPVLDLNGTLSLRHDLNDERLFLKIENRTKLDSNLDCLFLTLSVKSANFYRSTASVLINIVDNRLDRPVFDFNEYNFTLVENSNLDSIIGKVNAKYRQFNDVKYRIVPSDFVEVPVKIDANSGEISPRVNIDREAFLRVGDEENDGVIRLNVEASHDAVLFSYCRVNIFIKDVNDNEPLAKIRVLPSFQDSNLKNVMRVGKSTPANSILAYLAVFDPDSRENGTVRSIEVTLKNVQSANESIWRERREKFKLLNKLFTTKTSFEAPFRVNKINEKMYMIQLVAGLDFKEAEAFQVEVKLKDNGKNPMMQSRVLVNLTVLDENENAPVFLDSEKIIEIDEEISDKVIFKAVAVDLDDGENGRVKYLLKTNEDTFDLDRESGELKLKRKLDFESGDKNGFDLVIEAEDNAEIRKRSQILIRVEVKDRNDNAPKLSKLNFNLIATMKNSASLISQVGSFLVTDSDSEKTNSESSSPDDNLTKLPFLFTDEKCPRNFEFKLEQTTPFFFLIEPQTAKSLVCKVTVFTDCSTLTKSLYEFDLSVSDRGLSRTNASKAHFKIEFKNETRRLRIVDEFNFNDFEIESVAKLDGNEQFFIDSEQFRNEQKKDGVFLVDFYEEFVLRQVEWANVGNESKVTDVDFDAKLATVLSRAHIFNLFDESKSLTHFQRFLLARNSPLTSNNATSFTIASLFFAKPNSFVQFVCLSAAVLCGVLVVFICCVCLVVRKNCRELNKNKNEANENKKNLNVMDDDGGFRSVKYESNLDPREKVSRYLNGLEISETQSSPMPQSSLSSLSTDSTNKQLISTVVDFQKAAENGGKVKTLSTTSSSCISDEGCYGSSDFSSDSTSKQKACHAKPACQDQLTILNENLNSMIRHSQFGAQTLLSNPPSIRSYNLSRFEKIYNSNNNTTETGPLTLLSLGSSTFDHTLSPTQLNPNSNQRQIVNSISGSYV